MKKLYLFIFLFFTQNALSADSPSEEGMLEWDGVLLPRNCDKDMYTTMMCMGEIRDKAINEYLIIVEEKSKDIQNLSRRETFIRDQKDWIKKCNDDCTAEVGPMPDIMTSSWNYEVSKCIYRNAVERTNQLNANHMME